MSGDIVVGELVRLAVERQIRDLERQSTPEFPYHFDTRAAEFAIEFFPTSLRHSNGRHKGKPFELEWWQAFGIACIHGWKSDADYCRRFMEVYWSTGRKSGKSAIGSGEAHLMAGFDIEPETGVPESIAEVILCATKKDQAEKVIFKECVNQREQSSALRDMSTFINSQITYAHNGGFIRCVGSDKPYDGLNTHAALKDEVHAWREHHRDFYDTITTGSGDRSQPINFTYTTAGTKNSKIWLEEYNRAVRVLKQIIEDETLFAFVFQMDESDDLLDESLWPKANPNLHISVPKIEYLRKQAAKTDTAVGMNRFKRYNMNMMVDSIEKAFDIAKWDACKGNLSDWSEADAVAAGADIGWRDDLASAGLVARFKIGELPPESDDAEPTIVYRYEIRSTSVMFDGTQRDLTEPPWADWCQDDNIILTQYPISELKRLLSDDWGRYQVHDGAYDPANGQMLAEQMEQDGCEFHSMTQAYRWFNEPIRDLLKAISDGRVTHDGCPVLRWAVDNAVVKSFNDQWMFDKESSSDKIDPIVSVTMAFWRCNMAPSKTEGAFYVA